jgi:hypothetical protein
MKCFHQIMAISIVITLSLSIMTVGFAAESNVASLATEVSSVVTVNISEDQAVEIALKAHPGAELISVKLYETAYTVRIATLGEKRYLKIGAMSGRILEDYLINAQGKIIRTVTSESTIK